MKFSHGRVTNYACEWTYIPFTMADALAILEINDHKYLEFENSHPNIKSFSLCPVSFGRIMLHNGWDLYKMAILLELDEFSKISLQSAIENLLDDIAREVEHDLNADTITPSFMKKCISDYFYLESQSHFGEAGFKFKYTSISHLAYSKWIFVNTRINFFLSEGFTKPVINSKDFLIESLSLQTSSGDDAKLYQSRSSSINRLDNFMAA